ncbi:MAG: hypothetical protein WC820_03795 [Spirochaetales bacterium]|jgi:hypothetical protein
MKKIVVFAIAFTLIIAMTGCASMLKSMGGVSKAELASYQAATDDKLNSINAALAKSETAMKEVEDIKAAIAKLSADLESAQLSAEELRGAKATLDALSVQVNTLSDETLLKLSQLIQNALAAQAK